MNVASKYKGPADALTKYETLVAAHPDVERKGAANPYTSRNGNMFSFLDPSGSMSLRLSPEDREEFLAEFDTGLSEQNGRVMNEYVVVPSALFADHDRWYPWLERSHSWIGTLKPKATKRSPKR